jgi:hypothetical protein
MEVLRSDPDVRFGLPIDTVLVALPKFRERGGLEPAGRRNAATPLENGRHFSGRGSAGDA